jgi:hypothetical protein
MAKAGAKGPSSLLRGGIPSGPTMNRKSLKQPTKPAAGDSGKLTSQKNMPEEKDDGDDQFYNMDELIELLDLQPSEV